MHVGIMRNFDKPNYLTKLTAIYSKAFGINVLYMRPSDVNIHDGTVNARMLYQEQWIDIHTEIPSFIDISQFCFKRRNKEIIEYLRNNTMLSDNGLNRRNKLRFIRTLQEDIKLQHLVIPTKKAENINTLIEFLSTHKRIILKPVSGQFGKDIYFLEKKEENDFVIQFNVESKGLTESQLREFYERSIKGKKYIIQRYIQSKTIEGHPYDCRIHMEKNKNGEWTTAKRFIRIGTGQKVVANLSQGGIASDLNSFLKSNFSPEIVNKIKKELRNIANTIPKKVEEMRKQQLMTLGIDVGIDKDGTLYIFEVNGAPGTSQLQAQAAELRAQYYSFMKNQILLGRI